ncbi:hypothetical protein [Kitasatospora sp. MBT63]|uniref:hypothetical protein n=1 Tax=Kitasatospora sp. MBT63 TaxID=1444768 RepID=UPI000539C640|nr:hypothetical protein [Kitasatospora sp. MBT63]
MSGPAAGPAPGADTVTDAFSGTGPVAGPLAQAYGRWALTSVEVGAARRLVPSAPDPADWSDPKVGWGLVLPDAPGLDPDALARAEDAEPPLRRLLAARRGRVLRYRAGSGYADWTLRDLAGGGDLLTAASPAGSGPLELPMYLLIHGTPEQIPWQVQYALNPVRHVGRLDLTGEPLARYVDALLDGWSGSAVRYEAPVVWSVDLGEGPQDITTLMRDAVGAPLYALLAADPDMPAAVFVDGSATGADGAALGEALASARPALAVTTSHGLTGPVDDPVRLREGLGLPVGQDRTPVRPQDLLAGWQPDGAVWVARACCSAGSDSPSAYHGLFEPGSPVDRTLDGVAGSGAAVAPLPRALLGAERPARAFVGQVEPAFDWTMSFPPNRQRLTSQLVEAALYRGLCLGLPVGLAMAPYYEPVGSLLLQYARAAGVYGTSVREAARTALDLALYSKVTAYDRAATVILGDPTAALRLPGR